MPNFQYNIQSINQKPKKQLNNTQDPREIDLNKDIETTGLHLITLTKDTLQIYQTVFGIKKTKIQTLK